MRALRQKRIRLDGRPCSPSDRALAGQTLDVPFDGGAASVSSAPGPSLSKARPAAPFPEILYEDRSHLILNKPANLPVQPDRPDGDSLILRVWERYPGSADFRPAPVHRLDRNVTGAVWIALRGPALRLAAELVRERRLGKTYWAVVAGIPPGRGEIGLPLLKDSGTNQVRVDPAGRPALTRYRTLMRWTGGALLELELVTGRPHQARIHCAASGFPLAGDRKYAPLPVALLARRPLLHARRLTFPDDPRLEGLSRVALEAPIPEDLADYLRKRGNIGSAGGSREN
jgi:23S rRNA pseudouridine955/2504/2580 synthase